MNVLQLLNYAAPYPGNFMCSINSLNRYLKGKGGQNVYIFPRQARNICWIQTMIEKGNIVYFKSGSFLNDTILLYKIVKKHNVKIVHIHFWNLKDCISVRLSTLFNHTIYRIIHFHNHYFITRSRIKEYIKKLILSSDRYIGCSKSVTNSLISAGFFQSKCCCIENAIDYTRLDVYDSNIRQSLEIPDDAKVILLFGFDYYRKGVDIVINSLKDYARANKIILAISLSANKAFAEQQIVNQIGEIPDWIRILPPRDDIATYYKMSDIFISSSREEGFCYSLAEAAYCGTMLVASDTPGQQLGIPFTEVYPVEDCMLLLDSLIKVFNRESDLRKKIEIRQKDYVCRAFDMDEWGRKILNVYEETLYKK